MIRIIATRRSVMRGLDPRIHQATKHAQQYASCALKLIMDCSVIGERSDAVLQTAMPGNDAEKWEP